LFSTCSNVGVTQTTDMRMPDDARLTMYMWRGLRLAGRAENKIENKAFRSYFSTGKPFGINDFLIYI
jgi:hypothetical protein